MSVRDVIIVGAGPSGLSAAIAAKQRGLDYLVLEKGTLVNSIDRFPPQMVFFTTPELLEIGGLPFISPYDKPTRAEALRYYRRVADTFNLKIAFGETVLSVNREEPSETSRGRESTLDPSTSSGSSRAQSRDEAEGRRSQRVGERGWGPASIKNADSVFEVATQVKQATRARYARAVILAIGYYDHPNRLNVPGEDLPHVHRYYGEPHPYYRQRVVIVGGGNSAAESALEMYRAGAHVTIVHRAPELKASIKYWVRPDIENRIKEGSIAARFNSCVKEIRPTSVLLTDGTELAADAVFLLVGYHADWDLMINAGIELTDRHAPVLDPETFETNVPNLFVAGGAVAGLETGNIFIENGRFHGERIIETIARRHDDVERRDR